VQAKHVKKGIHITSKIPNAKSYFSLVQTKWLSAPS